MEEKEKEIIEEKKENNEQFNNEIQNYQNKIYPKKNTDSYITPRTSTLLKNPLNSKTSSKIKVNILNNEENINSNNIEKRIRKSKSKPKLIKKDSKKEIITPNKSFNNKTVKNKNKKNDINYNTTINTFFTTQNDNKIYTTTTANTEKDLKVNTKTKEGEIEEEPEEEPEEEVKRKPKTKKPKK